MPEPRVLGKCYENLNPARRGVQISFIGRVFDQPMQQQTHTQHATTDVLLLADDVARTLMVARVLARHERAIDLRGLDGMVGLLCAKTLDLAPETARAMRPRLLALRAELDALAALLPEGAAA